MQMVELDEVTLWVKDVKDRYEREKNQGIEKWDLHQAALAHAGEDACARIEVEIRWRSQALWRARQESSLSR